MRLRKRLKKLLTGRTEPTRQSFGLNELDMKVKPYIDRRDGFFIEAGANDGLDQSNTAYFEKYRGWQGILVEPIPELAERCRVNRPRSRVFNTALVPFDFSDPTVTMRYANLMSLVEGGMRSQDAEDSHIKVGCEIQHIDTYELQVPARTLTSVLEEANVRSIDFFSLDVEGFELNVIRGLDLDRYAPRWMLIEAWEREALDAYLKGLYEPVAQLSHHDVLYRYLR